MSSGIKRDKHDKAVSDYVRARDKYTCRKCNRHYPDPSERQGLHCAHIFGRRAQSTRYDPENCLSLCFTCHSHFTERPVEFTEWLIKNFGQAKIDELRLKSNTIKKWLKGEKDEHTKNLKQQTKELIEKWDHLDDKLREVGL